MIKTDWGRLKGWTIKNVYYIDEKDTPGIYVSKSHVHYLPYGSVLLEFSNKSLIIIQQDIEGDGVTPYETDVFSIPGFYKINLKNDKIWLNIIDKTLKDIVLHTGHYYIGQEQGKPSKKRIKKEITATVELVFQHGQNVFISSAEFTPDGNLEQSLFDFILYTNREMGIVGGLIPNS